MVRVTKLPQYKACKFRGSPPVKGNPEPSLAMSIREEKMKEHVCEVCGRRCFHKRKADGKVVCEKHYNQYKKHGKFLDNNPRNLQDLNEIRVDGDLAFMDLYDCHCNIIDTVVFDREDIPKVQYTKWYKGSDGYAKNRKSQKRENKYFHREVLGIDESETRVIDHIDGNRLNNRKSNLRLCTRGENAKNRKAAHGIRVTTSDRFQPYIRYEGKVINLGLFDFIDEARWARWYAEKLVFQEFVRARPEPEILESRKKDIKELIANKVQRL